MMNIPNLTFDACVRLGGSWWTSGDGDNGDTPVGGGGITSVGAGIMFRAAGGKMAPAWASG